MRKRIGLITQAGGDSCSAVVHIMHAKTWSWKRRPETYSTKRKKDECNIIENVVNDFEYKSPQNERTVIETNQQRLRVDVRALLRVVRLTESSICVP